MADGGMKTLEAIWYEAWRPLDRQWDLRWLAQGGDSGGDPGANDDEAGLDTRGVAHGRAIELRTDDPADQGSCQPIESGVQQSGKFKRMLKTMTDKHLGHGQLSLPTV
jgi:hypothetical protein